MIYPPLVLAAVLLLHQCNTSKRDLSDSNSIRVEGLGGAYTLYTEEEKIFCRLSRISSFMRFNKFDITSDKTSNIVNSLSVNAKKKLTSSDQKESIIAFFDEEENKVSLKGWDLRNINGLEEEDEKKIAALALECRIVDQGCTELSAALDGKYMRDL